MTSTQATQAPESSNAYSDGSECQSEGDRPAERRTAVLLQVVTPPEDRQLVATFTVNGEPISKARARFTKRGSKVTAYTPQKTLDGEAAVAAAFLSVAKRRGVDPEATFAVHAHFINGTRQRRDVDNMVKLILDGLNGVAWPDDNQVTEIAARKSWGSKEDARTVVSVYLIGAMNRPSQPCAYCRKPFRTYDSWRDNPTGRKYCSTTCAYEHQVEKKARTCEQCGASFQAWGETKQTRFCSIDCKSAFMRVETKCDHCGETFTKQRSMVRKTNYCCDGCKLEAEIRRRQERRSKYFPGTCRDCGSGTTRKEYTRCNACKNHAASGKPK